MPGTDEGGFKPHPGDPWHPDWSADDSDEATAEEAASVASDEGPAPSKKKRRRGRKKREQTAEPAEAAEPVEAAQEVLEEEEAFSPIPPPEVEDDPFVDVLLREGHTSRGLTAEVEEEAPVPAWTSDEDGHRGDGIPVEQPSWIGQATAGSDSVETEGFDSTEAEEEPAAELAEALAMLVGEDTEAEQPELFETDEPEAEPSSIEEGAEAMEVVAAEVVEAWDDAGSGLAEAGADLDDVSVVGEFGVAGPEAFEALAEEDHEADAEWGSFVGAEPGEPDVGAEEAIEEWVAAPPPRKRRGIWPFRRRRRFREIEESDVSLPEAVAPPPGDLSDESAGELPPVEMWEPGEERPIDSPAVFATPDAGDVDVAPDVEIAGDEVGMELGDQPDPPAEDFDDVLAVVAEATDLLETAEAPEAAEVVEAGATFEPPPVEAATLDAGDQDTPAPADEEEPSEVMPVPADEDPMAAPIEPDTEEFVPPSDEEALLQPGDAGLEVAGDWDEKDAVVPAAWFAEVDEDTVVPPGDELEVTAEDERWEGTATRHAPSPEVFDVEIAEEAVEQPVEDDGMLPEGFEAWDEAVTEIELSSRPSEVYEAEAEPAAEAFALPEGFEEFPSADHPAEPASDSPTELAGMPTEEMPAPIDPQDFSEEIYAAGGTLEHRDLAESIAQASEADTQWQAISAAIPGVETGVVGFEDVADLASGEDYVAPVRSSLATRVLTGVALVALLFGSVLWAPAAFAVFVGLVLVVGLLEFFGTLRRVGFLPLGLFGLVGGVGTLVATWYHGALAIPAGILLTSMVTFFFYAFAPTRRDALTNGGLTVLGVVWVVGTAAFAIPIARAPEYEVLVLAIVAVTAAMDIGAYSVGRTWGRSPLAPVLSPNKTVEGLAGGVILAIAVAAAIGYFELGPFDLKAAIGLGLAVSVAAPLGDLAESLIKRTIGVKDMGATLPGHGGILDRIDALLFVIPAAWVLFEAIGYLG